MISLFLQFFFFYVKRKEFLRSNEVIHIENVKDILCDYDGVMGVPITFLDKYNSEQFEIFGLDRYVEDNPHYGHRFKIIGKETYACILIKRKVC